MEGVLFESSATTPYHFINQAELSAAPSEAVVSETTGIQYGPLDVALGVEHLQLLGIKYFMASSLGVQAEADVDPALTLVASTGPWPTDLHGGRRAHHLEDLRGPRRLDGDPAHPDPRRAHRRGGGPGVVVAGGPEVVRLSGPVEPAAGRGRAGLVDPDGHPRSVPPPAAASRRPR